MFSNCRIWCLVLMLGIVAAPHGAWSDPAQGNAAPPNPNLHTLKGSTFRYYLSLPTGWNADKTWPILVNIEGSGHDFAGAFRQFVHTRKDLPFIIVTPCLSSNGNDPTEEQALYDIVHEVQNEEQGADKFFLTGFSAGGHLTYKVILAHPELLAGAAPTSSTYLGRGVTTISTAPERAQLPIHSYLGDQDPHFDLYTQHWDTFASVARARGFENIEHTVVTGAGHSPFADEVMAFFASLLPK